MAYSCGPRLKPSAAASVKPSWPFAPDLRCARRHQHRPLPIHGAHSQNNRTRTTATHGHQEVRPLFQALGLVRRTARGHGCQPVQGLRAGDAVHQIHQRQIRRPALRPDPDPAGASFADMVALKGRSDIGDQINKKSSARWKTPTTCASRPTSTTTPCSGKARRKSTSSAI